MTAQHPLHILLADDEEVVRKTIGGYLRDLGHTVDDACDGLEAVVAVEAREYGLALIDIRMPGLDGMEVFRKAQEMWPDMPVVIISGHGTMETVIGALRMGAADFLAKPIKLLELDAVIEKCLRIRALRKDRRRLHATIKTIQRSEDQRVRGRTLIAKSKAMQRVSERIRQVAKAGCNTVLITGETGTGKEVVAREVHFQMRLDESPFIAVSCPAIPDSLVESELFGHMKGTFTGATADKAGCFEMANGGSLFLDEVADLSTAAQAKLLRVLETRTVRRIGGAEEIPVDVRVIAATNKLLGQLVAEGSFRNDLFYRLNLFAIELLPLRERREDILPLAEHFLSVYMASRDEGPDGFSVEAREHLASYAYPGNARELRNIVERAAILCGGGQIQPLDLALDHALVPVVEKLGSAPSHVDERGRILQALESTKWNRRKVAEQLDMPYSTLRYKLIKLGLENK